MRERGRETERQKEREKETDRDRRCDHHPFVRYAGNLFSSLFFYRDLSETDDCAKIRELKIGASLIYNETLSRVAVFLSFFLLPARKDGINSRILSFPEQPKGLPEEAGMQEWSFVSSHTFLFIPPPLLPVRRSPGQIRNKIHFSSVFS